MRLDEDDCWERLRQTPRAVLATVHAERGVDAVPVVFALVGGDVVCPVDAVKDKRGRTLQRVTNVRRDPRCVLLADHYEDDWTRLWWVRVHATATVVEGTDLAAILPALARRYPPYAQPGSVTAALRLRPRRVVGWQAAGGHR